MLEMEASNSKRRRRGDILAGAVHAKIVEQYVENLCDYFIGRKFAEAVQVLFKVGATDLDVVQFLSEQCVFAQKLDSDQSSDMSDSTDNWKGNWDFERIVPANEPSSSA